MRESLIGRDYPEILNYRLALFRVGLAAFRNEFVTHLTWRERWILEETELFGKSFRDASRDPQRPFASHPELPAARAKLAYMEWQRKLISEWFDEHGVKVYSLKSFACVIKAQFEPAFAHSFSKVARANSLAPLREENSNFGHTARLGRKPKWDWPGAMAAYAAHLANDADGLPEKQAEAERWVANWFVQNSDERDAPPITEIRTRVAGPIYRASRKIGNSKA
jgi:hypothetical protein